jgi:integrase
MDDAQMELDELIEKAKTQDGQDQSSDNPECQDSEKEMLLSDLTRSQLNPRQETLLNEQFHDYYAWMIEGGKSPDNLEGLAVSTAENYIDRTDRIYRLVWSEVAEDIVLVLSHKLADEICDALKHDSIPDGDETYSTSHKRKTNDTLRKYFQFKANERGGEIWNPPYTFNDQSYNSPDHLTKEERQLIREAALRIDTLPTYSDCTPEQRDRLKIHLSQKLEKPKPEVTPEDWKKNNRSWERPSLVLVSLDTALRPIEVNRAREDWLRLDKGSLYIPREEAAKSRDHWEVSLRSDTVEAAKRWRAERNELPKYDDTDRIWLTRENNPWGSNSLNYLFDKLCNEAGLDRTNRRLCWYSIRHSVGQHMADLGGLEEAKEQLRHKSIESTLQYTEPSLESRRSTLDKM